jgi:hypothetical protein
MHERSFLCYVLVTGATSEATSLVPPNRNTHLKLQSQAAAASSIGAATNSCQLPVEAVSIIAAMIGFPWLVPGWHPELRRSSSNSNSNGSNSGSSNSSSNSSDRGNSKAGAYVVQCACNSA